MRKWAMRRSWYKKFGEREDVLLQRCGTRWHVFSEREAASLPFIWLWISVTCGVSVAIACWFEYTHPILIYLGTVAALVVAAQLPVEMAME